MRSSFFPSPPERKREREREREKEREREIRRFDRGTSAAAGKIDAYRARARNKCTPGVRAKKKKERDSIEDSSLSLSLS